MLKKKRICFGKQDGKKPAPQKHGLGGAGFYSGLPDAGQTVSILNPWFPMR